MFSIAMFGLVVVVAAIVALVFLYLFFSRTSITRAVALQNVRDLRERLRDKTISPDSNSEMLQLYEQVVKTVLDPAARSPRERIDVDLDLHLVRKPDAEALVKLLLRNARFTQLQFGARDVVYFTAHN